jgi:hypothetical protein
MSTNEELNDNKNEDQNLNEDEELNALLDSKYQLI